MSNVVRFPQAKPDARHVLIETGWIRSEQKAGFQIRRYFLSVVEPDGEAIGVWDGPSHKDAMEQARLWDLPIVDDVIEGGSA